MPGKLEYSLLILEDEFRRIENRFGREKRALETEYASEERPTRRRAIMEEIEEINSKLPEHRRRFEQWQRAEMERFDKHGWYRCPRCWLEHGRLSEIKCSNSEFEGFECIIEGCGFFALTPEGVQKQKEQEKHHKPSSNRGFYG